MFLGRRMTQDFRNAQLAPTANPAACFLLQTHKGSFFNCENKALSSKYNCHRQCWLGYKSYISLTLIISQCSTMKSVNRKRDIFSHKMEKKASHFWHGVSAGLLFIYLWYHQVPWDFYAVRGILADMLLSTSSQYALFCAITRHYGLLLCRQRVRKNVRTPASVSRFVVFVANYKGQMLNLRMHVYSANVSGVSSV